MNNLIQEIEKWSQKYEISFQFWQDNNSVYISKDFVELHTVGGFETVEEVLKACLEWIYRVNRTPKNDRVV